MSRVCDPDLLLSIVDELRMPDGIRSGERIIDTEGRDKSLVWEGSLGQCRLPEEGSALLSIVETSWCFADMIKGEVRGVSVPQSPKKKAPKNGKEG